MTLQRVRIENFRLVQRAEIILAEGTNLFIGANAQGKTTVLEAIGYLATGRSFRTNRDRECIGRQTGQETRHAAIDGEFFTAGTLHNARVVIEPRGKLVWVDAKQLRALTELWGLLRAVFFAPADLRIIQGQPVLRRTVMDSLLGQTNPAYLRVLSAYNKALLNRNKLLRLASPMTDPQYDAFESAMADNAVWIFRERQRLGARLGELAAAAMTSLTGGAEALALLYESGFGRDRFAEVLASTPDEQPERLRQIWREGRSHDFDRAMTCYGPHRDDLRFEINGDEAKAYASQGQSRSAVLALRLAELDVLGGDSGRTPLLLLDDILGELDVERSRRFLEMVSHRRVQTIITATDASDVEGRLAVSARFVVANGQVMPQ